MAYSQNFLEMNIFYHILKCGRTSILYPPKINLKKINESLSLQARGLDHKTYVISAAVNIPGKWGRAESVEDTGAGVTQQGTKGEGSRLGERLKAVPSLKGGRRLLNRVLQK